MARHKNEIRKNYLFYAIDIVVFLKYRVINPHLHEMELDFTINLLTKL